MIGMDGWMVDGGVSALPPAVHCVGGFRAAVVWRWQMNTSGRRKKKNTSNEKKTPTCLKCFCIFLEKTKKNPLFSSGIVFGAKCQKIPRAVFSERPCSQAPFLIIFFFPKTMIKLPHTALFFLAFKRTSQWLVVVCAERVINNERKVGNRARSAALRAGSVRAAVEGLAPSEQVTLFASSRLFLSLLGGEELHLNALGWNRIFNIRSRGDASTRSTVDEVGQMYV